MADVYSAKGKKKGSKQRVSVKLLKELLGESKTDGLFTSYATFPPRTHFESQEDGEEVVLFLRQHLIVTVPWIAAVLVALAVPSAFEFFPPYAGLPGAYQLVIDLMWYLFVAGYAFAKLMSWFFNIYILTDERIVDVDFTNILYRKISTAKIEEIQDLHVVASGAFETFFNYGSIFIQTAAEVPEFEFLKIPRPDKVSVIINEMIDMEEQEKLEGRVK